MQRMQFSPKWNLWMEVLVLVFTSSMSILINGSPTRVIPYLPLYFYRRHEILRAWCKWRLPKVIFGDSSLILTLGWSYFNLNIILSCCVMELGPIYGALNIY